MNDEVRKARASALLRATETGDRATLAALLTADARLWIPQSATTRAGLDRPLVGAPAIVELLGGTPNFASMTWEIRHCVGDGDYVAVQAEMTGTTAVGNDYQSSYVWLFRFSDERVAEMWEYADTAYAYERIGI
jgi:ketosteroid isomerase-like protein